MRDQPTDGLTTWDGELRSGARANVLMGVASNRVDVHQLAAHAERSLERFAEPLSALLLPAADHPLALLDIGWRQLMLNSAHDSSCACSADDVVEAVRVRYQEARHVGEALTREALRTLATTVDIPPSSTIVVNSTARDRSGVVHVPLPGTGPVHLVALDDGAACPTQVVHTTTTDEGISTVVVGQKIRWVLEMMRGPELAGARITRVEHRTLAEGGGAPVEEFTFLDAAPGEPEVDLEATKEQLLALGEAGATISIRQRRAPGARRDHCHRHRARLRLAVLPRRRRRWPDHTGARQYTGGGQRARQRARVRHRRPRRRHRDADRRRCQRRRAQPLRRRR